MPDATASQTRADTDKPRVSARLSLAVDAAHAAGDLVREMRARTKLGIDTKHDGTPVTEADRGAERLIRDLVGERFPTDAILGEEFDDKPGEPDAEDGSRYRWVLDPIDGTISYVHNVPLYGCLIAITKDGKPHAGVIHMPGLGETVFAEIGGGCWHMPTAGVAPVRARVSSVASFSESLICQTSYDYMPGDRFGTLYTDLCRAARRSRGWSDCYGHLLVATGRAEACVDGDIALWDFAAAAPLITEAGGRFTDWAGVETLDTDRVVLSNGHVHDEVLALTKPLASEAFPPKTAN